MSNPKSKSKKSVHKKNQAHVIPPSKTAKGRRPHTEPSVSEPYQTSLLSGAEWETPSSALESDEAINLDAVSSKISETPDTATSDTIGKSKSKSSKEEEILEGQPAPRPSRTKIDLKNQIESVKGMVQMGTAIVKSSFPKPFEIAEKVVENWKEDGDFSELPIEQPLVQFYLGLGLRKAKQTEKDLESKLETAGVLPVFRQQWQKAQKLFK